MVNDSIITSPESNVKQLPMISPRTGTLNFIKQFARTYVGLQGCALSTMILN